MWLVASSFVMSVMVLADCRRACCIPTALKLQTPDVILLPTLPCTLAQGDTPPELVNRWGCDTLDHYLALYQSPEAPAAGGMGRAERSEARQEASVGREVLCSGLARGRDACRNHTARPCLPFLFPRCGADQRTSPVPPFTPCFHPACRQLPVHLLHPPTFPRRGADQRVSALPPAGARPRVGGGGAALQVGSITCKF